MIGMPNVTTHVVTFPRMKAYIILIHQNLMLIHLLKLKKLIRKNITLMKSKKIIF